MDSLGNGGSEAGNSRGVVPPGAFPLSPAQLGMWFAQHVDPTVPANIAQYVELEGDLDLDLLHAASVRAAREMGSGFLRFIEVDAQPTSSSIPPSTTPSATRTCGANPTPVRPPSTGCATTAAAPSTSSATG